MKRVVFLGVCMGGHLFGMSAIHQVRDAIEQKRLRDLQIIRLLEAQDSDLVVAQQLQLIKNKHDLIARMDANIDGFEEGLYCIDYAYDHEYRAIFNQASKKLSRYQTVMLLHRIKRYDRSCDYLIDQRQVVLDKYGGECLCCIL